MCRGCSAYGGYVLGLGTTIVVMNVFEAAQPALLYIVPAVLAAVLGHAAINKQFLEVKLLNCDCSHVPCLWRLSLDCCSLPQPLLLLTSQPLQLFIPFGCSPPPVSLLPFKLNCSSTAVTV